jgi:Flp pilus assembly pilin Flp
MSNFNSSLKDKKGQGLTEYGIILVLVAVAAIGVFAMFGGTIRNKIAEVTEAVGGDTDSYKKQQAQTKKLGKAALDATNKAVNMQGPDADDMGYSVDGAAAPAAP